SSTVAFASSSVTTAPRSSTCTPARCSSSRRTCRTRRRRSRTRSTSTSSTRRARTGSTARTRISESRPEGQQLRPVLVKPVAVRPPPRPALLDERPEPVRVVVLAQMAQLVDDDVVEHLVRSEHEPPVERERASRRAGSPERALGTDVDAAEGDAERLGLLVCDRGDELARGRARFRLAHGARAQAEPRDLAGALLLDPGPLLLEHLLDLGPAHPPRHGQAG